MDGWLLLKWLLLDSCLLTLNMPKINFVDFEQVKEIGCHFADFWQVKKLVF